MSERVLSLVTFLRDLGGEPTSIEAKARTFAEEGIEVGTFAGIPVVANEECPPNTIFVLPYGPGLATSITPAPTPDGPE